MPAITMVFPTKPHQALISSTFAVKNKNLQGTTWQNGGWERENS